jgi:hypothetical protein
MRTRTRNFILGILAVLVVLVALGALPGLLKSGDPYYLTVTPQGDWDADNETLAGANQTAVDATDISADRYPYTTAAFEEAGTNASGQSEPYWKGYVGLKETFTHSPFDERDAFTQQNSDAVAEDGVYVHHDGTVYLLTVTQEQL